MTPPTAHASTSPAAARDIEACAARWVLRRRDGLDQTEERQLAAWLAAETAHATAYARLAAMADALQRARSAGAGDAIMAEVKRRAGQRRRRTLAAVGGVAAVAWLALLWPARIAPPVETGNAVAARSLDPIRRLPDGTIVELNAGAELAVAYEPAVRQVTLRRGEALFRVKPDATRPFVVQAGNVALRAVGTAFNVRLEENSLEVLVTEGKVAVADVADGRTLLPASTAETAPVLAAGQSVSIGGATGPVPRAQRVETVAPPEVATRLAWRVSRLEFAGIGLAEAVAQINRVNTVQIELATEDLGRRRISGRFAPDDPATFARLAAASLDLAVDDTGNGRIVLREAAPSAQRE